MGARPSVDYKQVCLMVKTGLTDRDISERLGISSKTVQRIRKKTGIKRQAHIGRNVLKGSEEHLLWKIYAGLENESKTAYRFGVTRQAVNKALKKEAV